MNPDLPAADADAQIDAGPPPRWGLGDVILGLVVGLFLSSVLAGVWMAFSHDQELSLGGMAFAQVGLWLGLVGSVVLATRRKGSGSLTLDFGWAFRRIDLAVGLGVGIGAQLVIVPGVALLLRPLLGQPEVSGPVRKLVDAANGPAVVGLILIAVVGAPLVEELFFRGLLLRSIEKRFGSVWAIVGSSVLFGLAHPQDLPAKAQALIMVSLAVFGAALATLAVKTRRLGPGILAHATFNLFSLIVALHT
jgi:membrane protease YdiL (CAAX protease family)